jgi:hypothetical protein
MEEPFTKIHTGQCGGKAYTGPKKCIPGTVCKLYGASRSLSYPFFLCSPSGDTRLIFVLQLTLSTRQCEQNLAFSESVFVNFNQCLSRQPLQVRKCLSISQQDKQL